MQLIWLLARLPCPLRVQVPAQNHMSKLLITTTVSSSINNLLLFFVIDSVLKNPLSITQVLSYRFYIDFSRMFSSIVEELISR